MLLGHSLRLVRSTGDDEAIAGILDGVASAAAARADRRAGELFGAVAALREAHGAPRPPADEDGYRRAVTLVRTTLGDDAFAAAETLGVRCHPRKRSPWPWPSWTDSPDGRGFQESSHGGRGAR